MVDCDSFWSGVPAVEPASQVFCRQSRLLDAENGPFDIFIRRGND